MDNEKYLNQLVQELRAKQEKEKDITAAAEYASNLLKLHLPVIFDRKHFAFLTGCELSEITKMMALIDTEYYFEAQIPKNQARCGIFRYRRWD